MAPCAMRAALGGNTIVTHGIPTGSPVIAIERCGCSARSAHIAGRQAGRSARSGEAPDMCFFNSFVAKFAGCSARLRDRRGRRAASLSEHHGVGAFEKTAESMHGCCCLVVVVVIAVAVAVAIAVAVAVAAVVSAVLSLLVSVAVAVNAAVIASVIVVVVAAAMTHMAMAAVWDGSCESTQQ